MSKQTSQSQARLAVDDGPPIVIDTETAHDEVFRALSNQRRRKALCVLVRESTPMDLDSLTGSVAETEVDDGEEVPKELSTNVRMTLYHMHLPKLDELGLIEFDSEELVVERVTETVNPVSA